MIHWTTDAGHIFILGRTQTGKTTVAREIQAENNRVSIWLNEQGDGRVSNVSGKRVSSIRGLESGMADDVMKYNFLASDRTQAIRELQRWAWEKADRSDRKFRMQIVVDEIHRLAPQSGKDSLPGRDEIRQLAKEGMKRNCKLIGITQDPVAFDKQSLRQREYLAVYGLSAEQANYISDYGVDPSKVHSQEQYAGVVYHADGSIISEGVKAQGKYA